MSFNPTYGLIKLPDGPMARARAGPWARFGPMGREPPAHGPGSRVPGGARAMGPWAHRPMGPWAHGPWPWPHSERMNKNYQAVLLTRDVGNDSHITVESKYQFLRHLGVPIDSKDGPMESKCDVGVDSHVTWGFRFC